MKKKSMTLGGVVCIRNGDELGFCWRESIQSLLDACDVVGVSDGESTDGTQEALREWMTREPRLILNVYPWPAPHNNPLWYADWIQYARMHTPCDYIFHLDADEVLHEESYDEVRRIKERGISPRFSLIVERLNFWLDHRHTIQEGICLGKYVIRVCPQDMFLASDGFDSRGTEVPQISRKSTIRIMHYGFIREPAKFFVKERLLQQMYFGTYDARLEAVEGNPNWMAEPSVGDYCGHLDDFTGNHPKLVHPWLKSIGYQL